MEFEISNNPDISIDPKIEGLIREDKIMLSFLLKSIKVRKAIRDLTLKQQQDLNLDLEVCRVLIEGIKHREECLEGLRECKKAREKIKDYKEAILDVVDRIKLCKVCSRMGHLCKRHILQKDKDAWKEKYGDKTPQEVMEEWKIQNEKIKTGVRP